MSEIRITLTGSVCRERGDRGDNFFLCSPHGELIALQGDVWELEAMLEGSRTQNIAGSLSFTSSGRAVLTVKTISAKSV